MAEIRPPTRVTGRATPAIPPRFLYNSLANAPASSEVIADATPSAVAAGQSPAAVVVAAVIAVPTAFPIGAAMLTHTAPFGDQDGQSGLSRDWWREWPGLSGRKADDVDHQRKRKWLFGLRHYAPLSAF